MPKISEPRQNHDGTGFGHSWRDRASTLLLVPAFLRLVLQAHRGYACAVVGLLLLRATVPIATLWIGKLIIDAIMMAVRTGVSPAHAWLLWRLVAAEAAISLGGELLVRLSALSETRLRSMYTTKMSVRLIAHAATLDLATFEEPAFRDHLDRVIVNMPDRTALLFRLLGTAQSFATLAAFIGALSAFDKRLLPLLVLAVIPSFLSESHFSKRLHAMMARQTSGRRQLEYLRYLGTAEAPAKEVKLFGLAPWLISRYSSVADKQNDERDALVGQQALVGWLSRALGTVPSLVAYVIIVSPAVTGAITLGTFTFLSGVFMRAREALQDILGGVKDVAEHSLYLRDLFGFLALRPRITSPANALAFPRPIKFGIEFQDVGFHYPESDRWAVRHLNLTLRAGEHVALVGENGAGKTTITKLIARLYDPSEGRILVDGIDLREYDLGTVRQAVGVIFQDFNRYEMRLDENIGIAQLDVMMELLQGGGVPDKIVTAAERSLAAPLVAILPKGYAQVLGRAFEGGVALSGGEWQKVALARGFLREAQMLIFDEPTAALDARAEYEVYRRLSEHLTGRLAIVISHRLSTVRTADRIVVLRDGALEHEGTHEELVSRSGLYAELFAMQAQGYA